MHICGADKATIRAYLGYRGRVRHSRRGGYSYVQGIPKKGYLEIFGYARREKFKWYLFHENIPSFPYRYVEDLHEFSNPPNPPSKCNERVEGVDCDVKKISLSQRGTGIEAKERPRDVITSISNKINNNNIPREREIFDLQPQLNSKAQLTPLEKTILRISKEGDTHG